jgi:MFS family permease
MIRNRLLSQPRAVWAVAVACVIAFMGLGLVDPILPGLAKDLNATPSQVELLFSSYTLSTGVAMLITSTVSSWLGAKKTLLAGLAFIIVFSVGAGSSGSIAEIVGFRAGWGLGNALFIATALAVIVGAASGGIRSAVVLYEAAIGIGIASGPILGGIHAHRIDSWLPRYRDCSTAQSVVLDRVEESGGQIGAADAGSALDWPINPESISPFRGAIGEVGRT